MEALGGRLANNFSTCKVRMSYKLFLCQGSSLGRGRSFLRSLTVEKNIRGCVLYLERQKLFIGIILSLNTNFDILQVAHIDSLRRSYATHKSSQGFTRI